MNYNEGCGQIRFGPCVVLGRIRFKSCAVIGHVIGTFSVTDGIVIVDSHYTVIVRERKGEDLPMKLLLALNSFIEFDHASYGNYYTMGVLSVDDFKRNSAALHFAREERKIYSICYHEEGDIMNGANERIELFKLLIREYESPGFNIIIRLRP